MTREEAINYAEAIKAKTQEKIEFYRRGNAHAPEVYYSDLAFLSAAISALREQEERENLKPLTLEELRQTHNPVWCSCELLDGGNGFWCLCINGKIIAPSGDSFDVEEIPNWVFLRNKPKEVPK